MRRLAMILMLAGLFAEPALALDDVVTVQLEAQNDSGETGTATLLPQGDKTKVVILLLQCARRRGPARAHPSGNLRQAGQGAEVEA